MSDEFIAQRLAQGELNQYGQLHGVALPEWRACPAPQPVVLQGKYCRLEPLSAVEHAAGLHAAMQADGADANWTYLGYGPFASLADYTAWLTGMEGLSDPQFYTIVDIANGQPVGLASYLRIDAANGVIEVGHLNYSPLLQQKPAATEAMYLMMRHAFELGYRRYEWKCNALNLPSRRAAERLGFLFEGLFRQSMVIKGRNRDTAWYSILDSEWPAVRQVLEQWLNAENFDATGRQRQALSRLMSAWRNRGVTDN
ncbi:GNAT family N-acetyltransferase [Aquitalea sp. LB_tupeE]|uniref:GNAT family N-acetyltransferase n=1 Tax=Aquitalea sp. LB_tupeE TaxID=2748078 RepID=UPI0015BB424C|nr:GNAT family protein [Aquitalea sp. LB_tupeE]NWK77286.1 GNAT family N-acetyltransferase [Aquitalea sp. LB_tupeE]